jgi:bacterioferritin-associated ferredoxin
MYVCLCHNVTDTEIRHRVRTGEVSSMRELREQLGVATQCGKCARCAKDVLKEAIAESRSEMRHCIPILTTA